VKGYFLGNFPFNDGFGANTNSFGPTPLLGTHRILLLVMTYYLGTWGAFEEHL
jgi:hypothetical protein